MNKWVIELTKGWKNERMKGLIIKWVNEWMNKWVNERKDE